MDRVSLNRLSVNDKRFFLVKIGHHSASYLSDDYIVAWFSNYLNILVRQDGTIDVDNINPSSDHERKCIKTLKEIFIDYIILEE